MRLIVWPAVLSLACCFSLGGCGDDRPAMVAVTGKVTFNGQPLTAGSIYLHPDATNKFQKDSPSSQLQLDGTVTFKTYPFGDGVPLGKYKVTLAPALASRIGRPDYSNVEKTPWVLEVTESGVDGHEFIVK